MVTFGPETRYRSMTQEQPPKERWGTRLGIILAVAGSAIGLGNYLRFPGLAAQYGGGVFLIPYFTAFILLGLPLAWSEWALGRYGGRHGYNSVPGIFRSVWKSRMAPYLGIFGVIMPVMIFVYYVYVEAWCLSYALRYLFGLMSAETLGITADMVKQYLVNHADLLYDYLRMTVQPWELNNLVADPEAVRSVLSGNADALTKAVKCNPDQFTAFLNSNYQQISAYMESQPTLRNSVYYNIFFANFTGLNADGEAIGNVSRYGFLGSSAVTLLICFVLNFWIIFHGISKGIEKFCVYAMPALFVCSLVVLVRVLTLGTPNPDIPDQNLMNGLGYMWNPVKEGAQYAGFEHSFFGALANPAMWMAAAGQVFFSLSVGFGLILTYASYLKSDDDIALSCMTACSANSFCEVVLGGLITIPAAFVFLGDTYLKGSLNSSFDLGFKVLPNVFNQMYMGSFFGFLFFFLLFLAAVTSTISMLQPAIALFEEGLHMKRKDSVAMLAFICLTGTGFVVYFSKGLAALDNIDFWMGNVLIFLLATIQSFLFAFALGVNKGMDEVERGAEIEMPAFLKFIWKYVTPSYLLIVFLSWIYMNMYDRLVLIFTNRIAFMSVVVIAANFGLFFYVVRRANRRWKKQELKRQSILLEDSLDNNSEIS